MMDKSGPVNNHPEEIPASSSGVVKPEANPSGNHGSNNVSLRPGGGSISLRPGGGGVSLRPGGGVSLRPGGPSLSAGAVRQAAPSKVQVDELGPSPAEERAPGDTERHQYTQSELLKYKEVSKGLPKELLSAGLALLRADGQSQADGNWNTRRDLGAPPPAPNAPDERDWKARTPLPPPPAEQAEQNGVAPRSAPPQDKTGPKKGGQNVNGERGGEPKAPVEQKRQQPQGPAVDVRTIAKTANPWKAGGVQDPSEKLYKTVKGVLNKLTPDNYEKLFNQIVSAGITNADMLRGVISLIFDKAVLEPTFCPLYAELCVKLSKALPEFKEGDDKPVTFRRVMLNTCQEEFEAAESLRDEVKSMTKPEQAAEKADKEQTVKRRTMGNIKLIGELYKQKMIPEKIIHACLQQLLGDPKADPIEENTEALVHLLTTVGKQLEMKPNSKKFVGDYFENLKTLQVNRKLQTRIRFLVRDLIERRANDWVPRREELKVTTTANKASSLEAQFGLIPPKGMKDGPLFPEGPKKGSTTPVPPVEDGWEVVGLSGKRAPRLASLPGASPVMPPVSTGPPTLLPGMGPQRIPPPQQFAGRSSALIGSGPGARPNPPPARKEPPPEPKPAPVSAPVTEKPAAKKEKPLSEEEQKEQLVKKTDSFLKEYLSAADIKEAALCVSELKAPSYHSTIVQTAINLGFEGKDRDRELVGKLLPGLVAQKAITAEELEAGFMALAEQLDDLTIDLPRAPSYLGDFVGRAIATGTLAPSFIKTASEKAEDCRARRQFAAAALQTFKTEKGEGALFKAAKELDLKSFLVDDLEGPLDEFLKKENLSILA